MNIEQERADFEAWYLENYDVPHEAIKRKGAGYAWIGTDEAWEIWQAAQAALQSQDREDAERLDFLSRADIMGCSLVSDDDGRWAFSDSGVAPVPPEGGFTGDVSIVSWVEADMWKESPREAIDHARRTEGE